MICSYFDIAHPAIRIRTPPGRNTSFTTGMVRTPRVARDEQDGHRIETGR